MNFVQTDLAIGTKAFGSTGAGVRPGSIANSPDRIQLALGALHTWEFGLDRLGQELAELHATMSGDERGRADRFRFERDRLRYIAGRGILRKILERYTGKPASNLVFGYGPAGKPELAGSNLQFNMSHSGRMAILAVTCDARVGIDMEEIRPVPMMDGVMQCSFSPAEREAILALEPQCRLEAFYTCWTRKEAYVKATGQGLGVALDRFTVSVVPGSAPRLVQVDDAPEEKERWDFRALSLGQGFAGVVVREGPVQELEHMRW